MTRRRLIELGFLATLAATSAAHAGPLQPLTVTVETGIDLGSVTASPSGDTVFRITPVNGFVTKLTGAGARASAGSTRALVRVECTEAADNACNTSPLTVQVTAAGAPSGRARALANPTTAMGTAVLASPAVNGPSLSFTIAPVGEGLSKTFYIGADFPIAGDEVALASGESAASFLVTVSGIANTSPAQALGQARARVIRALSMSRMASLNFGTIVRPLAGDGLVTIDAASSLRTVTGGQGLGGGAGAAGFTITGQAGETVSVGIPPSITLTGASTITVTTSSTVAGTPILQGAQGGPGEYTFRVGGSFPIQSNTPTGAYTGAFTVTADYN